MPPDSSERSIARPKASAGVTTGPLPDARSHIDSDNSVKVYAATSAMISVLKEASASDHPFSGSSTWSASERVLESGR